MLPYIKRCPCCESVNVIKVNKVSYENTFKSFSKFILKKKFKCRKCKEELGYFVNKNDYDSKNNGKIIWISNLECEDRYYDRLCTLQSRKNKLSKTLGKKYHQTIKEIDEIQKQIYFEKIKLKIKLKIQKKGMLIRHLF